MSIIHKALKKTNQPVIADSQKTNKPSEIPAALRSTDRRKTSASWRPFLVLGILLLVVAPIFAGKFLKESGSPQTSHALAQFAIEEAPLPPPSPAMNKPRRNAKAPFELSGVVYSEAHSYCLINGVVVSEGESVGGAIVQKITPEEVTLIFSGQKITLPVAKG